MNIWKKLSLGILFLSVLVLVACSGNDDESSEAAEDSEKQGDIVIGVDKEVVSLDPHNSNDSASAQVRMNIYETLIYQNPEGELVPGLATEWEQVDENTWNFKLREGVTFHSGQEFTAEDVKATYARVLDPNVAASVQFLFEMIDEVEVVNDHELNIKTKEPFAPLDRHLAHSTAGIMSKSLIDKDYENALEASGLGLSLDEYYAEREEGSESFAEYASKLNNIGQIINQEPDGTNHLKLQSRSAGDNVVLEKFEEFNNGERFFNSVTFKVIPENGSRVGELETGGIDVATGIDTASVPRIEGGADMEIIEKDSVRTTYLGLNYKKELFQDENIKKAIAYAIDREDIVNGIFDGMGVPSKGPLAPPVWGYSEELVGAEYDIEKAKEYLSQSSQPDGFKTTLWVNEDEQIINTAVYIQEQLKQINIDVSIEQMEWGAYLDNLVQGNHDMFILGWTTVTQDADYGLYALFHSKNHGSAGNRIFYTNSKVDELLDAGRSETDEAKRADIYKEAEQLIVDDGQSVFLMHNTFFVGVNTKKATGFKLDSAGSVHIQDVRFK